MTAEELLNLYLDSRYRAAMPPIFVYNTSGQKVDGIKLIPKLKHIYVDLKFRSKDYKIITNDPHDKKTIDDYLSPQEKIKTGNPIDGYK